MQALSNEQSNRGVDDLIRLDHQSLWDLYDRYCASAGRYEEQQAIANELVREIAVHSAAEETTVYGDIETYETKAVADGLRGDHQRVKEMLYELEKHDVKSVQHAPLLGRIISELKTHALEEEERDLPRLRALIGDDGMIRLGHKFVGAKRIAPTHPHPSAPDKPLAETIVGGMTAPVDKLRDATRQFAERRVPEE
ncbi:hypothetical protein H9P43_004042 [Blastocladiella emersonii ATCC 22665]|nr:hypothetical protein H9P43_003994 [Blastocladiella emersonii ATCC 22665]KAI9183125.1 hypothetical protein H9P43_004042 [Blastocladiella emersonii ATCC 22665]